jgi:hypothetical protein
VGATVAPAVRADPAAGEALFREARRLFDQGKIDEACRRFADSQALDPSSGTLLNLADCHAEQGKTATAWAEFVAAAQLAEAQHKPQHAAEARRRADVLEARLSYLTIAMESPPPGLEVRRDTLLIPAGVLGTRIPVDPGEHRIVASSPGYQELSLTVRVGLHGDHRVVTLPPLAPLPRTMGVTEPEHARPVAVSAPVTRPPADESSSRSPSVLPWVIGGAGAAALATGGVFGVLALRSENAAERACSTHKNCSEEALDAERDRDRKAWTANIAIGAGLVGVGVAIVMLVTEGGRTDSAALRRRSATAPAFQPGASVEPGVLALHVTRRF